jgi:N utilization substance protein A
MNAEFLAVLDQWEKEKGIPKDRLLNAVQESLVAAAKKAVGPARELRVSIDPKSGATKAWAKLIVAEKVLSKHDQISIVEARRHGFPDVKQGDEIEIEVTPKDFGRIAAQHAKQALLQQVRRAEKEMIFSEFKDRVGDIVNGTVRRFERSDVVLDLGKAEALMPNRERVPTEEYQIGERIRCYVKAVEQTSRGPEVILSRADPAFVLKLFRLEVSEISDGTIEVKEIAREPGFRTKLAVYSRDSKVDPVGACVGLRGQRVKNIVRELNNEKVDIIPWSPDVKTFIANALAPARLKNFQIDEAAHRVYITCAPDQLSLAIGKRGQNTRLTERITGWRTRPADSLTRSSTPFRSLHTSPALRTIRPASLCSPASTPSKTWFRSTSLTFRPCLGLVTRPRSSWRPHVVNSPAVRLATNPTVSSDPSAAPCPPPHS